MEQERKRQKEIELANQQKHEEKLKNELRSQIQLKCQKEKEMLEMKSIEEKFGTELEIQVRQEMGLPAKKSLFQICKSQFLACLVTLVHLMSPHLA